ncbi:MAG: carboxypeptidase-like regulatory domain-containing protein [candidate division WOR-3 bacterium]
MGKWLKLLLPILFFACSPERDNPYDPKSDFYTNRTQISGTCKNRIMIPVSGAKITLLPLAKSPLSLQTFTNDSGSYEIPDCPAESVLVIAEKDGFVTESSQVLLKVYKPETLNFILEALPKFLTTEVTSYYCLLSYPPYDSTVLVINSEITDDEGQGDITTVFATIDGLPDTLPLFFQSANFYTNSFLETNLSENLDNIVGRDIILQVIDRFGNKVTMAPCQLIRVIRDNTLETVTPAGGEVVSPYPILRWRSANYLFNHSFFCEIYYVPTPLPPVLCYRYENIPAGDSSFLVTDSLIDGFHYWQIGVRDSYGNWAKSAPGVFFVQSR